MDGKVMNGIRGKTMRCCRKMMLAVWLAGMAVTGAEVHVELAKGAVYRQERVAFWRNCVLTNGLNRYAMTFLTMKPHGQQSLRTRLSGLHAKAGFTSLVNIFDMQVNGIPLERIFLGPKQLVRWEDQGEGGVVWKMNFDGVRLSLRLFMRPDSGVLWGELRPERQESLDELREVRLEFACVPSKLLLDEKGHSIFHSGYERRVKTPVRLYTGRHGTQTLTAEDGYLIFHDGILDGTAEGKGFGPCMLILDTEDMKRGILHLHNVWRTAVTVELKADFKAFRFGIWNPPTRLSNEDFLRKVKSEPSSFSFQ